jgi:hypothetical protein
LSSISQSIAPASPSGSKSSSAPRSRPATSSSSTTCSATKNHCQGCNPGQRRAPAVPSALQPRPQPDQAGLRQAETPTPESCRTIRRSNMAAHRFPAQCLPAPRMRQLPQKLGQWCSAMSSRSRLSLVGDVEKKTSPVSSTGRRVNWGVTGVLEPPRNLNEMPLGGLAESCCV